MILIFADSIKHRVVQTFGPSVDTVIVSEPGEHTHPQTVSENYLADFVTHAGICCLVVSPHCEHSWGHWQPLTSGSEQSNDHLLHMSDSTCIQKRETWKKRLPQKPIKDQAVFI